MKVSLSADLFQLLQANGETGYPLESAGLLIGKTGPSGSEILEILALENIYDKSEQRRRYSLDPLTFFDAEEQAESKGLEVVGIFHSHPDHPPRPSGFDLEWALPNYLYIITSVRQGKAVETRAWRLVSDRSHFEQVPLEILQPSLEGT